MTFIAQAAVEIGVLFIEVKADFLQHRLGIGSKHWMLSALDQLTIQLAGVGHVEISHHHESARGPVAAAQVGMAGTGIELARGAVAQVTNQNFPTEVEVLFDAIGLLGIKFVLASEFVEPFDFRTEQAGERILFGIASTENIGGAHGHIELRATDADAIVTTVVLLFHE